MKKLIPLVLSLMVLPSLANAAPNFSGTWVLDAAKSDKNPYPLYWMTRNVTDGFRNTRKVAIEVTQSGDTLRVSDQTYGHPVRTYMLDSKARMVTTDTGLQKVSITATAEPDALIISMVKPFGSMPGNVILHDKQVWTLSPNGKVLTVTINRYSPARNQVLKVIYNKQ